VAPRRTIHLPNKEIVPQAPQNDAAKTDLVAGAHASAGTHSAAQEVDGATARNKRQVLLRVGPSSFYAYKSMLNQILPLSI
jgi:hypothetical protein